MKRSLIALVAALLPILASCSSADPTPIAQEKLLACDWTPAPKTAALMDSGFACLDGSGAPLPAGFPAPAIINVWGSWCAPCRDEIPFFIRLADEYDVTIIGVDVDEPSIVTGQRFVLDQKMPWPNVIDTEGGSTAIFGNGVPVTWFIGADGSVLERRIGVISSYRELVELARKNGLIR